MKYVKVDDVLKYAQTYGSCSEEQVQAVPVEDILKLPVKELPEPKKIERVLITTVKGTTFKIDISADSLYDVLEQLFSSQWISVYDHITRKEVLLPVDKIESVKAFE